MKPARMASTHLWKWKARRRTLHPVLRDEIYRIAGEALRNAFRHAQARRIEVEIRYGERQFRLRVRDDGKGIDPEVLNEQGRAGHWGLPGMRERAERIGGSLEIWSELDSGTEVELSIPRRHRLRGVSGPRIVSGCFRQDRDTVMRTGIQSCGFGFWRSTITPVPRGDRRRWSPISRT